MPHRAAYGYGVAAVKAALGMGNNIHFFTPAFFHDLPYAQREFLAAAGHGSGGLLVAIVEERSVSF